MNPTNAANSARKAFRSPVGNVPILVAEDDVNDIAVIKRAFRKSMLPNSVLFVHDGEEAMHYLAGQGRYADREAYPIPSIFFLDIRMPKRDGFDVLAWIQSQPSFENLMVVILTTLKDMASVEKAYGLGAKSFLVKPVNALDLVEILERWTKNPRILPEVSSRQEPAYPAVTNAVAQ